MNITKAEIEEKAKNVWKSSDGQQSYNLGLYDGSIEGAEWMQQKLQQCNVSGSLPPESEVEKWFAGGKVDDAKFWADAPFRDNGDVVGIVIDALKHFMGGNDR